MYMCNADLERWYFFIHCSLFKSNLFCCCSLIKLQASVDHWLQGNCVRCRWLLCCTFHAGVKRKKDCAVMTVLVYIQFYHVAQYLSNTLSRYLVFISKDKQLHVYITLCLLVYTKTIFCCPILLFSSDLIDIREKYFKLDSLKVLFKQISSDIIFNFLKEISIFYKLFKFLIRNIHLVLFLNCLNVWRSETFSICCCNLM